MTDTAQECPTEDLLKAVEIMQDDDEGGLARLDSLLADYPADARLHFLKGSLLAGLRRYEEAHVSMRAAVEAAPDYAIARFQLGFLEFTSGDFPAAQATWAPLLSLDEDNALRTFTLGLGHLGRDEFPEAVALLNHGIAQNTDNAPINNDMRLILQKVQDIGETEGGDAEPLSSTQQLLQQYAAKTRH